MSDPAPSDPASDSTISQSPKPAVPLPVIQIDGYRMQNEISRGGQAVVYSALFLKTGRRVAVKVMREGPLATENGRARFTREAQILASLNHPNIVTILDRGTTTDGSEYFAMDYIGGQSLDDGTWKLPTYMQAVNDAPAMPLQLFLKICDAVNAAHLRGIVHRDLKPSNIRLDERNEPHVLDFGLARGGITGDSQSATEPVTITGQFLGSLPWASPEQAEGIGQKIDMRSDVYSLGVILYQLVTGGRFPYQVVGSMRDVLNNIMTAEPPAPSEIMGHRESRDLARRAKRIGPPSKLLNPMLDAIILRALAKRRDDRYQSAGEMARDIEAYLAGRPLAAAPGAPPASGNKRTLLFAGIGAAAVALIGASIGITYMLSREKPAPPVVIDHPTGTNPASPPATLAAATATTATVPAPTPTMQTAIVSTAPIHPLVAASPLKADYLEAESVLNRFSPITSYIHTHAQARIADWRAAAERGDPVGQMFLARCYEQNEAVNGSAQEANRNLRLAADQGLPMALCLLGMRFRASQPPTQDFAEARSWYQKAIDAGSPRAMVDLAVMDMQAQGAPADYPAAMRLLRQSADLGTPAAYNFLGDIYRYGYGVTTDAKTALTYYIPAAESGVPQAMLNVGQVLGNARSPLADFPQALHWLQKADAEGMTWAAYGIGELYANGNGVPQNLQTALPFYQKAANNNVLIAERKLGSLYEAGTGVPKDHTLAVAWYSKAANAGDAEAKQWLATNAATTPAP